MEHLFIYFLLCSNYILVEKSYERGAINVFYRSSRIFRSFLIIFKPRLPFSPDWVFESLFLVPLLLLLLFFILPSNFEEERKKCSSWKKESKGYVRNFFSEITYGTNKRSGMRANKSCVSFTLRARENIYTKGSVFPMQYDLCVLFPCSDHFRSRRKEKLLFSINKIVQFSCGRNSISMKKWNSICYI